MPPVTRLAPSWLTSRRWSVGINVSRLRSDRPPHWNKRRGSRPSHLAPRGLVPCRRGRDQPPRTDSLVARPPRLGGSRAYPRLTGIAVPCRITGAVAVKRALVGLRD